MVRQADNSILFELTLGGGKGLLSYMPEADGCIDGSQAKP